MTEKQQQYLELQEKKVLESEKIRKGKKTGIRKGEPGKAGGRKAECHRQKNCKISSETARSEIWFLSIKDKGKEKQGSKNLIICGKNNLRLKLKGKQNFAEKNVNKDYRLRTVPDT